MRKKNKPKTNASRSPQMAFSDACRSHAASALLHSEDKVSVDHVLPFRNSPLQLLPVLPVHILSPPLDF